MGSPGQTQASQPEQGQPSPRCMHGKGAGARQINDMWRGRIYRRPHTWKGAATATDTMWREGCRAFDCRGREWLSPVQIHSESSSFVHEAAIVFLSIEPETPDGQGNGCGYALNYNPPSIGDSKFESWKECMATTQIVTPSRSPRACAMVTLASYIALNFHLSLSRVIASLGNTHDVFSFEAS